MMEPYTPNRKHPYHTVFAPRCPAPLEIEVRASGGGHGVRAEDVEPGDSSGVDGVSRILQGSTFRLSRAARLL